MQRLQLSFILTAFFIIGLCQSGFAKDRISVFVTIAPQKYFVQQIGKDLVDVQVMVHPGADPHTYEPKPQQMVAISKAKLYFAVGIEFEEAKLGKITATNPNLKVIHTDHGIEKLAMEAHHHHDDHEKGEHHGEAEHDKDHHEHAGLDPHIWLSPPLVKIQARAILDALKEVDPGHRSLYEANFKEFTAQIDQLDADLKKTFTGKKGLQFMVFHPAWGYFAHAYGLKQVPIEIEGKDPKATLLKELIEHARENGIKIIFVQPQFSAKSAELVAREIGGQVAFADPLAEDWMANLREVADKFKAALK
jgi:zinc transport system substrate-binding protein